MKNISTEKTLQVIKDLRQLRAELNSARDQHNLKSKRLNTRHGYEKGDGAYASSHTPLPALVNNQDYMRESKALNESFENQQCIGKNLIQSKLRSLTIEEYFVYQLTELPFCAYGADFEKILFSQSPIVEDRTVFERSTIASAVGIEARLRETSERQAERVVRIRELHTTLKSIILQSGWRDASSVFNLSSLNVTAKLKWKRLYSEYVDRRDFYLNNIDTITKEYELSLITAFAPELLGSDPSNF